MKFNKKYGMGHKGAIKSQSGLKKSRKQVRKEKRNLKKQHRCDYYLHRSKFNSKVSLHSLEHSTSESRGGKNSTRRVTRQYLKNVKHSGPPDTAGETDENNAPDREELRKGRPKALNKRETYRDPVVARKMEEAAAQKELEDLMRETRNEKLNEANEEEEKLIKRLEKQLKLSKRKRKSVPKSFSNDGLDYLLDVCDSDKVKQIATLEKALGHSDSEFEDDFSNATVGQKLTPGKDVSEEPMLVTDATEESMLENNAIEEPMLETDATEEPQSGSLSGGGQSIDESSGNNVSLHDAISDEVDSDFIGSDDYDCEDTEKSKVFYDEYFGSEEEIDAIENCSLNGDYVENVSYEGDTEDNSFSTENMEAMKTMERAQVQQMKKSGTIKKAKRVLTQEDDESDETERLEKGKKPIKRTKVEEKSKRRYDLVNESQPAMKKKKMITKGSSDQPGKYVRMYNLHDGDHDGDDESEVPVIEESNNDYIENNDTWEDIYGRLRDSAGNILPKNSDPVCYVPPALRAQPKSADEVMQERTEILKRLMKGYLNRLTESNIPTISTEMESLYNNYSRHDMNSTFTTLLFDSVLASVLSLERLAMEHAALVACLHSRVGSDVGAYVLQSIVKQFDSIFKKFTDSDGKKMDNIIMMICYLYNFKVVHSRLVFDVLHRLAERFNSTDVECVLLILRIAGFGLRKDDPAEMKSVMLKCQGLADANLQKCTESRLKFMLEVLMAIKNNHVTRVRGYDPEPVDRMRKLLRSLTKGNFSPELNISLQDLLDADERGRWWVVGSAWSGQVPGGEQQQRAVAPAYCAQLLELARSQQMNTELRRNIFCILMTAEDYQEAFKNLMQLGLKDSEEREVVHIALQCCLQEKTFNIYYAHVLKVFCGQSKVGHARKMTLQFAIWDKFKQIGQMTDIQLSNLSILMQHLLIQNVLTLRIFKVLDLTQLERTMMRLLRRVLLGILTSSRNDCERVFSEVTKEPKYKVLTSGLRVFLQQYVRRRITSNSPEQGSVLDSIDHIENFLAGSLQ